MELAHYFAYGSDMDKETWGDHGDVRKSVFQFLLAPRTMPSVCREAVRRSEEMELPRVAH